MKFQELTKYIKEFEKEDFGRWCEQKGKTDQTLELPYVDYSVTVDNFIHSVANFSKENPDLDLANYRDILEQQSIGVDQEFGQKQIGKLDDQTILALIVNAIRTDKFDEGFLLRTLKRGQITVWLKELQRRDK